MSGQKKGRDLSQFNYGNMSSLVVNQGESCTVCEKSSLTMLQIARFCDKTSLLVFPNRSWAG